LAIAEDFVRALVTRAKKPVLFEMGSCEESLVNYSSRDAGFSAAMAREAGFRRKDQRLLSRPNHERAKVFCAT
jgi:hypothetical protein